MTALSEAQNGVVAAFQMRGLGYSDSSIQSLRNSRRWDAPTPRVLRLHGSRADPLQRATLAVLDCGPDAILSHRSAEALWLDRQHRIAGPIHIETTRNVRRSDRAVAVHRVRRIDVAWRTTHLGVPVARPEMVALHLFASSRPESAERRVDVLWSNRLISGPSLAALLRDLGKRGRNGTAGLRAYLDERGETSIPPATGLESRVLQILRDAAIPARRQVDVGSSRSWCARVDFLHHHLPLVIEVQSQLHHGSLTDQQADKVRRARLEDSGYTVVEVWDTAVWSRPSEVVRQVRDGMLAARASRPASDGATYL